MFTRKQYMNKECSHHEYYAQFGKHLTRLVAEQFGDRIKNSTDEHFNDIPLKEWDSLHSTVMYICGQAIADANETGSISQSDCVCSLKAAAHMVKEGQLA